MYVNSHFSKPHPSQKEIVIWIRWMISALRLTSLVNQSLRCHQSLLLPLDPQGTKGFKCDVCAREFTLSANLRRHMLIHASVRPFQCHVCFKSFVQKQTLKTHMIVHLPVKPFKCKVRLQNIRAPKTWIANCTHLNKPFQILLIAKHCSGID